MGSLLDDYGTDKMFTTLTDILFLILGHLIIYFFIEKTITTTFVKDLFIVINNASYGYIASYIFYIINIHLPEKKKRSSSLLAISYYIATLKYNLDLIASNFGIDHRTSLEEVLYKAKENPRTNAFVLAGLSNITLYGNFLSIFPQATAEAQTEADHYHDTFKEEIKPSYAPESNLRTALICTLHSIGTTLSNTDPLAPKLSDIERYALSTILYTVPLTMRNNTAVEALDKHQNIDPAIISYAFCNVAKLLNDILSYFPVEVRNAVPEHTEKLKIDLENTLIDSINSRLLRNKIKKSPA